MLSFTREAFVDAPPTSIIDPEETVTLEEIPITPDEYNLSFLTLTSFSLHAFRILIEHPLSARLNKQNENVPSPPPPVLIESTLLLMPEQAQNQMPSADQPSFHTFAVINDLDPTSSSYRRGTPHRVPVPIHDASQWFNGPDMQNERSGRMEKVVSSILRRSLRPMSNYAYVYDRILFQKECSSF